MKQAIIVICYTGRYGWDTIIGCINSIRKYDNSITIIIVNNYNESCLDIFLSDKNIRYLINEDNTFELGAIKKVIYNTNDIDSYYIIHDSCRILDTIVNFKETNTIFWKTTIADIAPVLSIVEQWCISHFKTLLVNNNLFIADYIMCQGLMGYFNHNLLVDIFEAGLKYITVHSKLEAVASEGIFGMLLKHHCPSITSYYPNKLDDYISNRASHLFIQKLAGGKNPSPISHEDLIIPSSSIAHPSFQYSFKYNNKIYNSLQSALYENTLDRAILLEYYTQNIKALLILTDHPQYTYHIEQYTELGNILNTLRHTLHIIKHTSTV